MEIRNFFYTDNESKRFSRAMGAKNKFFDVADDEDVEFRGSEELKKAAEEELRETDSLRTTSLQQLREAIRKHPEIKKCRTG